jgi:hypothetical protein
VAIQSKKENAIRKTAEPDDPGRSCWTLRYDVIKKASELNVEKEASSNSERRQCKDGQGNPGDKPITENSQGKYVKKQNKEKKSTRTDKKNAGAAEEKKSDEEKKGAEEKDKREQEAVTNETDETDTNIKPKKTATAGQRESGTSGSKGKERAKT